MFWHVRRGKRDRAIVSSHSEKTHSLKTWHLITPLWKSFVSSGRKLHIRGRNVHIGVGNFCRASRSSKQREWATRGMPE
jgi:hypothetical protein